MLIDDDQEELDIMNEAINEGNLPAVCLWVNGVEQAIHLLDHVLPDIILVDINMPIVDGFACIKQLSKYGPSALIPKMIYSTHVNEGTMLKAKEAGAMGCIQKPNDVARLIDQLNALFKVETLHS